MFDLLPIIVVIVIFLMSLIGAYILFKILKSTAVMNNAKYQAGGALAGFIILYGTIFGSYHSLQNVSEIRKELDKARLLQDNLGERQINGTIIPSDRNAKIVLAVQQTGADDSGNFRLLARCIDPKNDDLKIFVIHEDKYQFKRISSRDDINHLQIKTQ